MMETAASILSALAITFLAWIAYESSVLVSEKKAREKQVHGVSSGEQKSKQKHMDDIL